MSDADLRSRLSEVFDDVLGYDGIITDDLSLDSLESLDSLGQINLLMGIQMEFSIKFSIEEMQAIKSVKDIIQLVQKEKVNIGHLSI